jgi:hypothetical protein
MKYISKSLELHSAHFFDTEEDTYLQIPYSATEFEFTEGLCYEMKKKPHVKVDNAIVAFSVHGNQHFRGKPIT